VRAGALLVVEYLFTFRALVKGLSTPAKKRKKTTS
jgi:hypothetical protein